MATVITGHNVAVTGGPDGSLNAWSPGGHTTVLSSPRNGVPVAVPQPDDAGIPVVAELTSSAYGHQTRRVVTTFASSTSTADIAFPRTDTLQVAPAGGASVEAFRAGRHLHMVRYSVHVYTSAALQFPPPMSTDEIVRNLNTFEVTSEPRAFVVP